jgi:hypothetical protein
LQQDRYRLVEQVSKEKQQIVDLAQLVKVTMEPSFFLTGSLMKQ